MSPSPTGAGIKRRTQVPSRYALAINSPQAAGKRVLLKSLGRRVSPTEQAKESIRLRACEQLAAAGGAAAAGAAGLARAPGSAGAPALVPAPAGTPQKEGHGGFSIASFASPPAGAHPFSPDGSRLLERFGAAPKGMRTFRPKTAGAVGGWDRAKTVLRTPAAKPAAGGASRGGAGGLGSPAWLLPGIDLLLSAAEGVSPFKPAAALPDAAARKSKPQASRLTGAGGQAGGVGRTEALAAAAAAAALRSRDRAARGEPGSPGGKTRGGLRAPLPTGVVRKRSAAAMLADDDDGMALAPKPSRFLAALGAGSADFAAAIATVVTTAPEAAAAAARRWLELLAADLKGRLAALRRSRKAAQATTARLRVKARAGGAGSGGEMLPSEGEEKVPLLPSQASWSEGSAADGGTQVDDVQPARDEAPAGAPPAAPEAADAVPMRPISSAELSMGRRLLDNFDAALAAEGARLERSLRAVDDLRAACAGAGAEASARGRAAHRAAVAMALVNTASAS